MPTILVVEDDTDLSTVMRESLEAAADRIALLVPVDRVITLAAIYDPGKVLEIESALAKLNESCWLA